MSAGEHAATSVTNGRFEAVIGLEVHAELLTEFTFGRQAVPNVESPR